MLVWIPNILICGHAGSILEPDTTLLVLVQGCAGERRRRRRHTLSFGRANVIATSTNYFRRSHLIQN